MAKTRSSNRLPTTDGRSMGFSQPGPSANPIMTAPYSGEPQAGAGGTMHDPLGAFCRHSDIRISGASTETLSGLIFAAKDLFDIEGYVTGAGNPDWLHTHAPAHRTAPVVQSLLHAGASLVGKTLTDELAFSLSGENIHYGTPLNPAAPERVPGGSSSGSASAVAGKLVDFALGTDTSGSIRIPASYCGLFGLRPTYGRIACERVVPLAPSFDTIGWFARDGEMLHRVGMVLFGGHPPSLLPGRLLIADDAFALVDAPLQDTLLATAEKIAGFAVSAKHINLSESLEIWSQVHGVLKDYEAWQTHGSWIETVRPKMAPEIEERFRRAAGITEVQSIAAQKEQVAIRTQLLEVLQGGALLCLPTAPGPAPIKNTPREALESVRHRTLILTCIAGLGGLPQITLPLAEIDGCPIGISLIAPPSSDEALLTYARYLTEHLKAMIRKPEKII